MDFLIITQVHIPSKNENQFKAFCYAVAIDQEK